MAELRNPIVPKSSVQFYRLNNWLHSRSHQECALTLVRQDWVVSIPRRNQLGGSGPGSKWELVDDDDKRALRLQSGAAPRLQDAPPEYRNFRTVLDYVSLDRRTLIATTAQKRASELASTHPSHDTVSPRWNSSCA